MEKWNKHYAKRDKESLSLARALWLAGDVRVSGSLPLYMIRARVRHEMGKFMKENKDHTLLHDSQPVNKDRWQDSMRNRPDWRKKFIAKYMTIEDYAEAPRELCIDPCFCPVPRRYTWPEYEEKLRRNPNLLNYPKLSPPASYQPLTEENFLETLSSLYDKYHEVPDVSCRMLCKFVNLFTGCIETFKNIQYQRTQMSKFSDADRGLAFDLQIGPVGDQMWGYYSRLQHIPAHFMNTWEEMMTT